MPAFGPLSISVPGTVHGWEVLLESEGTISLADALAPAIDYAENGFPVSDIIGFQWRQQEDKLAALPSGQEMLVNGRAPREGRGHATAHTGADAAHRSRGWQRGLLHRTDSVRHGAIRPGAGRLGCPRKTWSRTTRTGTSPSRRTIAG